LGHFAVPGLLHAEHTIDAFHQATGSVSPAQDVAHGHRSLFAHRTGFAQYDRT
jgi:hypothetical protein